MWDDELFDDESTKIMANRFGENFKIVLFSSKKNLSRKFIKNTLFFHT